MGQALRDGLSTFDLAHLHSVFLWPTLAAAGLAPKTGTPYVLTPHGMLVGDLIKRKSQLAKSAWLWAFEKRNIGGAAAIHAATQVEADEMLKLGLKSRRVAIVPYGVEPPVGLSAQVPTPEGDCAPFVLFLGRINWKKGLDRLIPAMTQAPGAELVIAGNDEENYRPKLEALAREMGVADRTRFIGPVHGAAKWTLLREAEMLALPSYSENFAIVVLEAMASGCPVVVTPEVGMAGAVRESGAGIVAVGDPNVFGQAVASLLADPERRSRMGEAGRRAARDIFSWDAVGARMERLYQECIEETRRAVRKSA